MKKGIFKFIGGMITGVILTLGAACLIPEDMIVRDRR